MQDTERTGRQTAKKRSFQNFPQPKQLRVEEIENLSGLMELVFMVFYGESARCFGMRGILILVEVGHSKFEQRRESRTKWPRIEPGCHRKGNSEPKLRQVKFYFDIYAYI